ncbi:hypothetical protein ACMAZF_20430 (plasmid) [Psychrobium sp. nBUS_13]|uniref:hypothetical protein n=1 Tax=Psychrobium sp. nBUS_13 TaxID=3395319 RepID=UPI003EB784F3
MKNNYLLNIYKFSLKHSKRDVNQQLKITKLMIRVVLFLVIGALIFAAVDQLSLATIISIGLPLLLIMLVLNLLFSIEHKTKAVFEELSE